MLLLYLLYLQGGQSVALLLIFREGLLLFYLLYLQGGQSVALLLAFNLPRGISLRSAHPTNSHLTIILECFIKNRINGYAK
ncbi:MAG: hypothetical protein BWK80_20410 [Desulfobacteraceae bacterium IS3]|nr:MAG: hypothetical protein BWK80_20410 [Desulfobacteraceae bacterium IS3]